MFRIMLFHEYKSETLCVVYYLGDWGYKSIDEKLQIWGLGPVLLHSLHQLKAHICMQLLCR